MECEAVVNVSVALKLRYSIDEGSVEAGIRPGFPAARRGNCDGVVLSAGFKKLGQIRVERD